MSIKKEDLELGKEFEAELKEAFKSIEALAPFFWHQFPDSKTAGKFIAAQPSDFMISAGGKCCLLEAKASVEKPSLAKCSTSHIRPSQVGMCKRWVRSGQQYLFIFYCELDNIVEIWDGEKVTSAISDGKKPNPEEGLLAKFDYFNLKKNLCVFLGIL